MARPAPAAGTRLAALLDALLAWAEALAPAAGNEAGAGAGVLIERLRARRAGLAALTPAEAARAEVATLADADALAAATGGTPPLPRASVAAAVRHTLGELARRHPGQLVEVRVPPWGAVQIGLPDAPGGHRRGTPPNVVETDATTWLRLATGALGWADARAGHAVSASGAHAELGDLLPLL